MVSERRIIITLAAIAVIIIISLSGAAYYYFATPSMSTETKSTLSNSSITTAPSETGSTSSGLLVPTHRIAVRVVNGSGQFYDRMTGEKFVPRGFNYVRLANQTTVHGTLQLYHSTFNVGLYDPNAAEAALEKMHSEGYNVIRVFTNGCCKQGALGDPNGGLSARYIANLVDFIQRAKANGIFVLITTDGFPAVGGYIEIAPWSADFQGANNRFLTKGGIQADSEFWKDFIRALISQGAPTDDIFGYDLINEAFYESSSPPLSNQAGLVTTANGKRYDMARPDQKQQMMDENLVNWIDTLRSVIRQQDPTALVTQSFFVPQGPNPTRIGDERVIRTYPAIANPADGGSHADFIDLHPYPGSGLNLPQYVQNFEVTLPTLKPLLMGEFGAHPDSYWSSSRAAQALQDWQIESCRKGFQGWLLWTWDTGGQPGGKFWNALDDEGVIEQSLSPKNRADPCAVGSFPGQDIAFDKPISSSNSLVDAPPSLAVDGSLGMPWNSGDFSPQWLEIDLGTPSSIAKVRLVVSQYPSGQTIHTLWGKGPGTSDTYQLLYKFSNTTTDGQVLEYAPSLPRSGIQFIKIETVQSPSWVAWYEIEVLSE